MKTKQDLKKILKQLRPDNIGITKKTIKQFIKSFKIQAKSSLEKLQATELASSIKNSDLKTIVRLKNYDVAYSSNDLVETLIYYNREKNMVNFLARKCC